MSILKVLTASEMEKISGGYIVMLTEEEKAMYQANYPYYVATARGGLCDGKNSVEEAKELCDKIKVSKEIITFDELKNKRAFYGWHSPIKGNFDSLGDGYEEIDLCILGFVEWN